MSRAQIPAQLGRPSSGPTIERFDYGRVGNEWAILRVLAGLGGELRAPWAAHLVVDPDGVGEDLVYAAASACGLERRLLTGRRGGSELLWRASFALPLDVVRAPEALFTVQAGDGFALALPTPGLRIATPRQLVLSPGFRPAPRPSIGVRQRFAALATAVVVTATSTPAVALASGETHSTGASRSGSRHSRFRHAAAAVASLTTAGAQSKTSRTRPAGTSPIATVPGTPSAPTTPGTPSAPGTSSTPTPAGTVPAVGAAGTPTATTTTGGGAAVT
ncbi:MAG TPA: hypothetical protein VIK04_04820, partial [Solirubrobacteraceae bacterium]